MSHITDGRMFSCMVVQLATDTVSHSARHSLCVGDQWLGFQLQESFRHYMCRGSLIDCDARSFGCFFSMRVVTCKAHARAGCMEGYLVAVDDASQVGSVRALLV